jgi:hypothetical protein
MNDGLDAVEGRGEVGGTQIEIVESERRVQPQGREIRLLDRTVVVRDEAVEADNFVPGSDQRFAQRATDKAGRTSHHYFHEHPPCENRDTTPSSGGYGMRQRSHYSNTLIRSRRPVCSR